MTELPKSEYWARRRRLLALLPANSIAMVPAATVKIRNRDSDYPFRQDSDFYYLTGFAEEQAVLVLIPGCKEGETLLFCQPKNAEKEIWQGYLAGPEGAMKDYEMDQAYAIKDLDNKILTLLNGRELIVYDLGAHSAFDHRLIAWLNQLRQKVRQGVSVPEKMHSLSALVHEMRLVKTPAEIAHLRQAIAISAAAHVTVMQTVQPGLYEYQLEAQLSHEFMNGGSRASAYSAIVGAGANACVLHYHDNNALIRDGDLVLVDAGCELDHYASDITRTFPANGRFSAEQAALYELVLQTQLAAIDSLGPGVLFNVPQEIAVKVLTQGLIQLGLLTGSLENLIEKGAYKRFYMHGIGHWLGMDVHDVGRYKIDGQWRPLVAGMVMTIEPGLYISPNDLSVPEKWRGIGIRIEDDILITAEGVEVLSSGVPKSLAEIEALVQSG